jgi:hypothetical protein
VTSCEPELLESEGEGEPPDPPSLESARRTWPLCPDDMFDVSKGEGRWEEGGNWAFAAFQSHVSRFKTTGVGLLKAAKVDIWKKVYRKNTGKYFFRNIKMTIFAVIAVVARLTTGL